MDTEKCCLYCDAIQGCRFLQDGGRQFSAYRVIKPDDEETCNGWTPLSGKRQKDVRDDLYGVMGTGSIRILYSLNNVTNASLKQMEEEEYEMNQTPDLASIIHEGMTVSEREYQLRYETDEHGAVTLDEAGNPTVRPSYTLRNFAISPDYHISLPRDVGWFWSTKQVVDFIIKSEVEANIIIKDSKKKGLSSPETGSTTSKPTETKKMAAGKRVILRRGGKKASETTDATKKTAVKGTAKGKTLVKKSKAGVKKGPSKAASPTESSAATAADSDVEGLVNEVVSRTNEFTDKRCAAVEATIAELLSYIEDLKATVIDTATLNHDVSGQAMMAINNNVNSLGTNIIKALTEEDAEIDYEPTELELVDLFSDENKILAYLEGGEEGDEGNE